jgi:uncharacterized membrane protein
VDLDRRLADRALEVVVARLLQGGVLLAATIVSAGSLVFLWRHADDPTHYRSFHGEPHALRSVQAILQGALAGDARAVTQLGLLVLIATPVARVALAALGFALERDRLYTAVALLVLGLLALGLSGL